MAIGEGLTIEAADIQAIKDDVDMLSSGSTATVSAAETTSSTTFANLTTTGPAVTLTTGTAALVIVSAMMSNNTAGETSSIGYAVSGASTVAATFVRAARFESSAANDRARFSSVTLETGLTAGSNTFTAKYAVTGGTGEFTHRELTVIPIGAS